VRRLFTASDAGLSASALDWGVRRGHWVRVVRGVYAEGASPPSELDRQRAHVLARNSAASGALAGVLHKLDGVVLDDRPIRRRNLTNHVVVDGVPCTDGLQTMIDLAAVVDDLVWEQALECALRRRLVTIDELEAALPRLGASRTPGTTRIRRVLGLRPAGAPPTESLLETLMVQLARKVRGLGPPTRQLEIFDRHGIFIARLDLSWPALGLFLELDGQQHKGQPVYDARRETAVVAATGWLPGRFTWHEVTRIPRQTIRRLEGLVWQASRRTVSAVRD
jgi:hypothetical protein